MHCVVYSSQNCPKCEILKRYLVEKNIEHSVRMVEDSEARVDALMLEIYQTPALVSGEKVLHQRDIFPRGILEEAVILSFLGR